MELGRGVERTVTGHRPWNRRVEMVVRGMDVGHVDPSRSLSP